MIRLIQRRLIVPRGDTGTFTIPVLAGKDTGDVSIFTVFDPLMHRKIFEKVMTLSGETLTMELTHGDTVNLPVGQYVWDIKFYTDPIFAEEKLIGGTEVDSYYAAFTLPVCEIRETGDNLLMSDDAPTGALKPGQIDFVTASINEMTSLKNTTTIRAAEADTSAQNAASSAQDALISQQAAQTAASSAEASAELATQKAAEIARDLNDKADKSEIPTKVSDLVDDSGHYIKPVGGIPASDLAETYLTSFTETDPTVPAWAKQAQKPSYTAQEVGALPADTVIPVVPTNISAFINDSGYLTEHQDISGKADKSEIPTSVSELTNDAGYLTSFTETDPTVPAWAKATTKPSYTAAEVGAPTVQEMNSAISTAIGNVNSFDMAVVQELPTQNINTHTIYLVPKTGETNDVYDEYIYINNAWEMVGNTQIDLSNYATKNEVAALINDTASTGDTDVTFSADKLTAMDNALKSAVNQKYDDSNLNANSGITVEVDTDTGKHYLIADVKRSDITTLQNAIDGKAPIASPAFTGSISMGRKANTTIGQASIAIGADAVASDMFAQAFGANVIASSFASHAEGYSTTASGYEGSHAEGFSTTASGRHAHSEGSYTTASGDQAHAEGNGCVASGRDSHAEGTETIANAAIMHVSGVYNQQAPVYPAWASGTSYAVGDRVIYSGSSFKCLAANSDETFDTNKWVNVASTSEQIVVVGNGEDLKTRSNAYMLDIHGNGHFAGDVYVGCNNDSTGGTAVGAALNDKAEKTDTVLNTTVSNGRTQGSTIGRKSIAFGDSVEATSSNSVSVGYATSASGVYAVAIGAAGTTASGLCSRAYGEGTNASGHYSLAQGFQSVASERYSTSNGYYAVANGGLMTAFGEYNYLGTSFPQWVAGEHYTPGQYVTYLDNGWKCFVENSDTTFDYKKWSHTFYTTDAAFVIGNGGYNPLTDQDERSNAMHVDMDGNERLAGNVYVNCNADSTGGYKLISTANVATIAEMQAIIDEYDAEVGV